jgi:hypothetical protein
MAIMVAEIVIKTKILIAIMEIVLILGANSHIHHVLVAQECRMIDVI